MSGVTVVAIVMAVGEAKAPTTAGLLAAAEEAFVPGTSIRISEVPFPSDDAALVWENDLNARAVILITWEDSGRLLAHIRLHVDRTDRWTDREIKFAAVDTQRERGRTLGFAIASMWPDQTAVRTPPAPAVAEVTPPDRKKVREPESDATAEAAPARTVVRGPLGPPLPRHAVGVAALIAEGIQGSAQGFGGTLDAALFLEQSFAPRVGVTLRGGAVEQLPGGKDVVGAVALGFEWWPLPPSTTETLGFGLRADALLLRHQVFDAADSQGRFLPGVDLMPQISIRFADTFELLVGAGVELAFGTTEVRKPEMDPTPVTTIPAFRVVSQAGVRMRF
jgi:hypothetical protein